MSSTELEPLFRVTGGTQRSFPAPPPTSRVGIVSCCRLGEAGIKCGGEYSTCEFPGGNGTFRTDRHTFRHTCGRNGCGRCRPGRSGTGMAGVAPGGPGHHHGDDTGGAMMAGGAWFRNGVTLTPLLCVVSGGGPAGGAWFWNLCQLLTKVPPARGVFPECFSQHRNRNPQKHGENGGFGFRRPAVPQPKAGNTPPLSRFSGGELPERGEGNRQAD